jgi:hypothetical protein
MCAQSAELSAQSVQFAEDPGGREAAARDGEEPRAGVVEVASGGWEAEQRAGAGTGVAEPDG